MLVLLYQKWQPLLMTQETITFQLATHYLPKVALRLECLVLTIQEACQETHPVIHHYALKNTIEVIKLIEKPELKSRFLKEFMRIEHVFNKTKHPLAHGLHERLVEQIQFLSQVAGKFGASIHEEAFLQTINLAQAGHHKDCELHSPQLLLWLESRPAQRQQDLMRWLKQLYSLSQTVSFYLELLRARAEFNPIDLLNGFYQRSLPPQTSCHLILLRMDKHCGIVPQMQLGHSSLSLRLCDASSMVQIRRTNTLVDLAICQL